MCESRCHCVQGVKRDRSAGHRHHIKENRKGASNNTERFGATCTRPLFLMPCHTCTCSAIFFKLALSTVTVSKSHCARFDQYVKTKNSTVSFCHLESTFQIFSNDAVHDGKLNLQRGDTSKLPRPEVSRYRPCPVFIISTPGASPTQFARQQRQKSAPFTREILQQLLCTVGHRSDRLIVLS